MRERTIAMMLAGVALLAGAGATAAPPGGIVVTHFYTFAPGDDDAGAPLMLARGTELHYLNLDGAGHTVTSVAADAYGVPLFDSGLLQLGEAAPVAGTASLPPGDHAFVCAVHPLLMTGILQVAG